MKANAPEKIYLIRNISTPTSLNTTDDCHEEYLQEWYKGREKDTDIEYIRTDVFIKKACDWFRRIDYDDSMPPFETAEEYIKDFTRGYSNELENGEYEYWLTPWQAEAACNLAREEVREQFEKERLKHCDELTAEQAQMESDFVVQHLKNFNRTPTFIDAIEYGRKQMIDKAIKWLEDNIDRYLYNTGGYEEYIPKCGGKMFEDFKKAMEE